MIVLDSYLHSLVVLWTLQGLEVRPSVSPLKDDSGEVCSSNGEMAQLFAEAFSTVFSAHNPENPCDHQQFDGRLRELAVGPPEIAKVLTNLNSYSSMGPDNVYPCLLKHCSDSLAYPLSRLFEMSLQSCSHPSAWKNSLVVPIFKKELRSSPLNYRPVSLTSVICKCLEKIVVASLQSFLEENDLLSADHFGFRAGRSVEDQLILSYNDITYWLDRGQMVDIILFDYSKTFNLVNHDIMIAKLSHLGISGSILHWIREFLNCRLMTVVVEGSESAPVGLQMRNQIPAIT
ncbi:hypothetical protein Pcinc_001969 [Petrolisthes cinctipes]|uniref:Reverse transcriptase domain-containing protein n=1 Tax=Petrolisthes cinctipes TaxID=88211 RepID=A0AAE1GLU9_PETCI|nr:hypothetical protein Pcinc_001969 [Petrolisthes cinctipes]